MRKFICGAVIGIFIGTTASAWAAQLLGSGTLNGWTVAKAGEPICVNPSVDKSIDEIDCE